MGMNTSPNQPSNRRTTVNTVVLVATINAHCTMNTSNNCCTSDDIKSSPIRGPRTLDPRIVNFGDLFLTKA